MCVEDNQTVSPAPVRPTSVVVSTRSTSVTETAPTAVVRAPVLSPKEEAAVRREHRIARERESASLDCLSTKDRERCLRMLVSEARKYQLRKMSSPSSSATSSPSTSPKPQQLAPLDAPMPKKKTTFDLTKQKRYDAVMEDIEILMAEKRARVPRNRAWLEDDRASCPKDNYFFVLTELADMRFWA